VTVLLQFGDTKSAPPDQWQPCVPVKNDTVFVVSGEHKGKVGKLVGIDNGDGIVRITGNESLEFFPLPLLVKYRDSG